MIFAVYNRQNNHFEHMQLCLEKCWHGRLSLNPTKCAFCVTNGSSMLGHIVSQEGIVVDPDNVKGVIEAPPPTKVKALSHFVGHIRWPCHMIRYLVDVATPLHATVHKIPF